MKRFTLAVAVCAAALALVGSASAATISTLSLWNGSDSTYPWGPTFTPTYGQTFTGTGETLNSFTFYFDADSDVVFRGAVYVWSGTAATTQLWQSGDMTLPGSGWRPVTFTPNVTLNAGQQYVLLATTLFSPTVGTSGSDWGAVPIGAGDAYPGGTYVYTNSGSSLLNPWDGLGGSWADNFSDLAFSAVLSASAGCADTFYANENGFCVQRARGAVCTKEGKFADVELTQLNPTDTSSPYYGATSALYVQGYGLMCRISQVASYGGDPAAFTDQGYKVDQIGLRAPGGYTDDAWNALYEYYAKA